MGPKLKTSKISDDQRAILREIVRNDSAAAAAMEAVLLRNDELEKYIAGLGGPLMISMG